MLALGGRCSRRGARAGRHSACCERSRRRELPRVDDIGIDVTVLLFTLSVSVLSGVLFGLFAVLRFGSPSLAALKEGGRSASDAPGRHRTRNALVVGQVALALTLLIVSGLMIRTFIAMRQVDPGFTRPEEVQTFVLAIPEGLISDPQQAARTYERVAERLAQVPGVTSVGLSSSITMDGEDNGNPIEVEDAPVPEGDMPPLRRFKSFGSGILRDDGQPPGGGALHHVERGPRAAAGHRRLRGARAGILERAFESDRQARARRRRPVARDRRRRRR